MAKPRVSMWLFGVAALSCLIGATAGQFPDLYIWTAISVVFALMSWGGVREKRKKEAADRAQYQSDLMAAARAITGQQGQLAPVPHPGYQRPVAPSQPETAQTASVQAPARTTPPAGWYRDPHGTSRLRYWNGVAWTQHFSE